MRCRRTPGSGRDRPVNHRAVAAVFALALSSAVWTGAALAEEGSRVHVVYPGHTLGKISKRYNVSIERLCEVNGIRRNEAIRPGQKIVIPGRGDADGRAARKMRRTLDRNRDRQGQSRPKAAVSAGQPRVHVVYPGHTLGKIARRYNVSIEALCRANGIARRTPLKPKQVIVVPSADDEDGSRARALRIGGYLGDSKASKGRPWRDYAKRPWRRGYVTLQSGSGRWKGYVLGPEATLLPNAVEKVSDVLASWRTGKRVEIDPGLIRLIARVSDTFGGRPIRVISGFREHSYVQTSKHPEGRALDFAIAGVPNEALRDYLRTLPNVGVGYYPNSTFVHMDVREKSAHWVDVSGPGEPPEFAHVK